MWGILDPLLYTCVMRRKTMGNEMKRLPDAELEIMLVICRTESPPWRGGLLSCSKHQYNMQVQAHKEMIPERALVTVS
jgi:hypothetical protein